MNPLSLITLPGRDAKLVLELEDIASAIDAGVPLQDVLRTSLPPNATFVEALDQTPRGKQLQLHPVHRAILEGGEHSGNIPAALRQLASLHRRRADAANALLKGLTKPAVLILVAVFASSVAAPVLGVSRWQMMLVHVGLVALLWGGLLWFRRRIADPRYDCRLPMIGSLLRDVGEIPYLWSLHGLYQAGIPIQTAHPTALKSSPVASVRARLYSADANLQNNQPLADSLRKHKALHEETLGLLQTAEQAGELEDGLRRAADRRMHTFETGLDHTVRVIDGTVYGLVVLLIAAFVLKFWTNYYSTLSNL